MDMRDFVVFDVREGGRWNGKNRVWVDSKDGECLVGVGDVGVVDVLGELYDHELADRVHDINIIGDIIVVDREISVRDRGNYCRQRYRAEDKGGGDGGTGARGRGGGGDIVHDVARGGSEFKVSNYKGHKVAG